MTKLPGKHKTFAAVAQECFSKPELAYIRDKTALGPSALDVVRQAVRQAADKDLDSVIKAKHLA